MTRPRQGLTGFLASCLLAAGIAGSAVPAIAITTPAAPATPLDEAGVQALLQQGLALADAGNCAGALVLLDPALPRVSGKGRTLVQLLRVQCLFDTGRAREVGAIYRELVAAAPTDATVRSLGVFVAATDGDFSEAARRVIGLAEEDPDGLGLLTGTLVRGIALELEQKRDQPLRDRLYLALARADWSPTDRPDMRDSLAQGAIDALLAARQVEEARTFLPRVRMPELLVQMATERRYASLWPAIEARLGAHGGDAVDLFARDRLADFARNPEDERATRDAARAFVLLGRYAEAGEVAGKVAVEAGMSEDAAATVRYHSQALAAQGKRGEAIERLRPFSALDPEQTPAAMTGVVALAELLDEDRQETAALAAARDGLARGKSALSPWGTAWLRRTEACALAALGRKEEGGRVGDALLAAPADNQAASIEALLCLGRTEAAAKLAIQTLATAEGTSALADQFQPDGVYWAATPSRLRALWAVLLARPDVRAAFEKTARILPRPLWPLPEPRPIPHVAGNGPTA